MGFNDILEDVGSMGKFQIIHILLLTSPSLLLTMHNLLQNFLAAVPDHHCRIPLEVNDSRYANVTGRLQTEELLRVFIPLDQDQQPEKCLMYSSPQWHLLDLNGTHANVTEYHTQKCTDGWTYDNSKFKASTVTEWDLVCDQRSLRWITQSIYMAGLLVGAMVLGRLSDKWLPESARWLILNDKADVALEQLRRVAKTNGKEVKGKELTLEILKSSMKDEQLTTKNKHGVLDLFRTPVIRKIACCTMLAWFATGFAYYGLAIDLQGFGVDIYLIQFIFGAVDVPAKFIGFISMSLIGRRFTHSTSLILAGCVIVANIFVPKELNALRTSLAAIGKGCLSTAFSCCYLYSGELYPTVVRQTGMGLVSTTARVGAMIAPIVRLSGDYVSFLPMTIYGGVAIVAGVAICALPETRNNPLPETIEGIENRAIKSAEKDKDSKRSDISLHETHQSLMKQTV
ncbi:solute carrier family 22 member 6-like isoform X2 [Chiloscyllium plagiosum]|uniref:solute carrier family 22 member 6-like isoform X2 n=1 Tax=Chiloscyllium plagiosum TaxID=36176 RepID=UPI001CB7AFB8|nr:solute carrier family 22 member 6-like isoform X2 [Chiloscyllium plagiosum]